MSSRRAVVLDTSGFLAKVHLQAYGLEVYTTRSVVEEVKDLESREALDLGLDIERVRVIEPSADDIEVVRKRAIEIDVFGALSKTDIEVASIAYALSKERKVIVFTDDYALQRLLLSLNIEFKSLRTRGIRK